MFNEIVSFHLKNYFVKLHFHPKNMRTIKTITIKFPQLLISLTHEPEKRFTNELQSVENCFCMEK